MFKMFKTVLNEQKLSIITCIKWYSNSKNDNLKKTVKKKSLYKTGYISFCKDNSSLLSSLQQVKTEPEVLNSLDLFNKDSEAFLSYSFDHRYKTIPKGQSVKYKTNHILNKVTASTHKKKIKISEFPESHLHADTEQLVKKIINERPSKSSKIKVVKLSNLIGSGNKNNDKESLVNDPNHLEFDKQKLNDFAQLNGIDINQTKVDEKSNEKLRKTPPSKVPKKDFDYWEKIVREEDAKTNKSYINYISKIFKTHDIDKNFLSKINNFPLTIQQDDLKNNDVYSDQEIKLYNEYLLNNISGNEILYNTGLPSVTKVLEIARSEQSYKNLLQYKIENIYTLGYDGFMAKQKLIKESGTSFHKFVEKKLENQETVDKPIGISPEHLNMFEKLFQTDIGNVLLIEKQVIHGKLFYQGKIDCLAYFKGNLCMIDWKSSERDKSDIRDLYENPIQLAAYTGALLNDSQFSSIKEIKEFKYGVIIHLNKTNGRVDVHEINYQLMEYYWYQWLALLKKFWNTVLIEYNKNKSSY